MFENDIINSEVDNMKYYLAIDVGGTNLKYAKMLEDGTILEQGEMPTPLDSMEQYIDTLGNLYDKYNEAEALVMSSPGRIDSMHGYYFTGGSLKFIHENDMATIIAKRIPIPFCAENDAKCAALAELWKGSMKGITNGAVMTIGTAIGGAVIIDGQLYRGSTYAAGEFSMMSTQLDDEFTEAQLWGSKNGVRGLVRPYEMAMNLEENSVDGRMFFKKVDEEDPVAIEALEKYCHRIVNGILCLQAVIDVEGYAIGGGISRQPSLIITISRQLDEVFKTFPDYYPLHRPEIVACTFGNDANMIGALYHYLYEFNR